MKNRIKKFGIYALTSLALFLLTYSTSYAVSANLKDVIDLIITLIRDYIIKLIFALAIVYFMWGVVQYVLYPDDEVKKDKGRTMMVTGIIALTVMFSIYGLIRITMGTFGVTETETIKTPTLPASAS